MDCSKLIVIKVGSQTVLDDDQVHLAAIARHISDACDDGYKVVLVSSGAVALGKRKLRLDCNSATPQKMKAMCATLGQDEVMACWKSVLKYPLGQVLVDREHLSERSSFVKTHHLIHQLLNYGVIPVINENDALNDGVKKIGNNDFLAAFIANMLGAHMLVLYTDVDGIYRNYPDSKSRMEECFVDDPQLEACVSHKVSQSGTGGMKSKIDAAKMVAKKGIDTLILNSGVDLVKRLQGQSFSGTLIRSQRIKESSNTRLWLSVTSSSKGCLYIDDGALNAIQQRKASLLLPGIKKFSGSFNKKDVVDVMNWQTGQTIAKGISRFSAEELFALLQVKSSPNNDLSHRTVEKPIVVHRNELALIK